MTTDMYNVVRDLAKHSFGFNHLIEYTGASKKTFPPFSIVEIDPNNWQLQLALAGYSSDDVIITKTDDTLKIESKKSNNQTPEDNANYIYKGIAQRSFRLSWVIDKHVEVKDANMKNGMLYVNLHQIEPTVNKKTIPINTK